MKFRKSKLNDLHYIMRIISQAQSYFKLNDIDQWQNNYPNENTIINDIENGYSYVLENNNEIIATLALSFDGEVTYNKIYDGNWLSNNEYVVIHRIAVANDFKGNELCSNLIKYVEDISLKSHVHSIKVDTHEDNMSMRTTLKKNNFKYCGIIYLEDKSKRLAFEKLI